LGSGVQEAVATESTSRYVTQLDYDSDNNLIYLGIAKIGEATSAAGWQVRRLTWTSGNLTAIEWADGDFEFDNVWDDRTTGSYS